MRVHLAGVTKHFGAQTVLHDVTLTVGPHARLGVVGPNGVGKSTLLRILAGVEEADAGTVLRAPSLLTAGYLEQERDARPGETLLDALARRIGVALAEQELQQASAALACGEAAEDRYATALERFLRLGGNRRRLITAWATKEFKNLKRMADTGTRVPKPVHVEENILVMGYMGDEERPAPVLRTLSPEEARPLVDLVVEDMIRIRRAKLVHGDLSEYNILVWEGRPYIIDVGQAVPLDHPQAEEWFRRDVRNMARYFKRLNVDITAEDLARKVEGG